MRLTKKTGRTSGRVTLADVAKRADVAAMTASRVLSNPESVSWELRHRVEQAISELGYVPNRAARALASARSKLISVLIPSLSDLAFSDLLAGIQDALDPDGYQLMIGDTRYCAGREEELLSIHLQSNPDGVLLTGLIPNKRNRLQQMLELSCVPVVSMMDLSDDMRYWSVGYSERQAGYTLTRYLLDRGYRRIGFIGTQLDERALKRVDGYRKALLDIGLHDSFRELMAPDPATIALGAELLGRMLANFPDCDAVVCCNDDLAQGVIHECRRHSIAVPGRLAVCGFDDLPVSACMNPSMTTIATPRYRVGFESASMLRTAISGKVPERKQIDLGFTLMARQSA